MAVTTIHAIKSTLSKAVLYIENPDKTDGQALVSGYNCEPQTAPIDFEMTSILAHKARNLKRKKSANLAYHLIQSFSPEDAVTPEQAHEIGKKLAFEFTGGKNEFVIATHIDKGHIHNHIILNAVSFYDYKKLRTVPYQTARQLRDISDRLCMDEQLSVITNPDKIGQLYPAYQKKKRTVSNRTEVRRRLNFCLDRAADYAQFVAMAKELGVAVTIRGKHISYLMDGAGRAIRDDSLSDTDKFTYAGIAARLADNVTEQEYIRNHVQVVIQQAGTPAELTEKLKAAGVEMRLKKSTGQMQYKATALDGVWLPADAFGDGYTAERLEKALKEKDAPLDASNSKTLEMRYRELTVNYPETGTSKVQINGQLIATASKRGLVLRVCDSNGNAAQICKTYKAVWLEYIGKPLAEKSQFFAAHNTELQAYQQAEKQLAKIEVAPAAEPEKINNLVAAVDRRMEELQVELNKEKLQEQEMRKEQQTVTAIQDDCSEQNRNEAIQD